MNSDPSSSTNCGSPLSSARGVDTSPSNTVATATTVFVCEDTLHKTGDDLSTYPFPYPLPFPLSTDPLTQLPLDSGVEADESPTMHTRCRNHRKKKNESLARAGTTNEMEITQGSPSRSEASKPILLLVGENYIISGSFGIKTSAMTPSLMHIDTCSGVNVIREQCLPPSWEDHCEPLGHDPGIGDATNRSSFREWYGSPFDWRTARIGYHFWSRRPSR